MRCLGIDLAAQPANTAVCVTTWHADAVVVESPVAGVDDEELLDAMAAADWIGIDAPFGWPERFVDAVGGFLHSGRWPGDVKANELRFRATDRFVTESVLAGSGAKLIPLSVSSDRIAACAWRCAALLTEHHRRAGIELDRAGRPGANGGVIEVYPAAALAMWGLPSRGYKSGRAAIATAAQAQREAIVVGLTGQAGGRLALSHEVRDACIASDHCLDALIAGLVARAAAVGDTIQPGPEQQRAAGLEGWIHVPFAGWLGSFALGDA